MEKQPKEPTENALARALEPREQGTAIVDELLDLARAQLRFATDERITEEQRRWLCRAAGSLLDAVIAQRDHASGELRAPRCEDDDVVSWRSVADAAAIVISRLTHE